MSGFASDPPSSKPMEDPAAPAMRWDDKTDPNVPQRPAAPPSSNAAADKLPTIGHIGRYALKYQIGEGGLGRVYAAHDPLLSRLIAIKTLNLEIAADERESFNALFLNEARAAGGLSHPHIVTVFDAGVSEQGAYIAMELLKGRDLRQLRQEGWKPTPTQAALIIRRVSDALAYAHAKGVVHRDIKPANIFMVGRTQPRVLDFGIARVAHHHDADNDIAGGSPYYMSPEQVRQQPMDRRCDVFSLGVVLYELLTGSRPFIGASFKEITDAVVGHEPPMAHELDASVPRALSDIAARAMEKNPENRFRSARALSRELRHWLEEHAQIGEPVDEPMDAPASKRGWVIAGLAAVVTATAGWWWLGSARQPQVAHQDSRAPITASSAASAAPATATATAIAAVTPALPASAAVLPLPATEPVALSAGAASAAALPASAPKEPKPAVQAKASSATKAVAPKEAAPKESAKERRAREAREREAARLAAATAAVPGVVRLAIAPWGQVEVDGKSVGTTPPINELSLSEGRHTITVRNGDFPAHSVTVNVSAGQAVSLKHRFGP